MGYLHRYISRKAETDLSLPRDDCNTLRYTAVGSSKVQDVIVDRLMVYGDLVESVVEANKDIRESDDAVIRSACHASEEGGGEEGIHGTHQQTFNFRVIQDHLLIVLQRFFSRERVMNSECDVGLRSNVGFHSDVNNGLMAYKSHARSFAKTPQNLTKTF